MLKKLAYPLMKWEPFLRVIVSALTLRRGCMLTKEKDTYLIRRKGSNEVIRVSRQHLLFCYSIAEHFDAYFSSVQPCSVGRFAEADFSRPKLHRLASGLEFEISSFPEEEDAATAYFAEFKPRPGDLVFDIGAYCGVFTYELSKAVGKDGKVIAFEPDPVNAEILRRNMDRHQASNVTIVQSAVSDVKGEATFDANGTIGSALMSTLRRPAIGKTIQVETTTFTSAANLYGVPSFVKIDAEGAEIEILKSSVGFLRNHRIKFVLDTNHLRDGKPTTHAEVEDIFKTAGYDARSSASFGGFTTTWAEPAVSI